MKYLGHLGRSDPFYDYLRYTILPQLGTNSAKPDFRVYKIDASNHVYLYQDRRSNTRIIGKFYGGISDQKQRSALRRMEREFNNLNHIRSLGFDGYPHHIPKPLGCNADLNCVLVEESCSGTSLDTVIRKAIQDGMGEFLFKKLTALAYFLASLHTRTATDGRLDFNPECSYFDLIVHQLRYRECIDGGEAQELHDLMGLWKGEGFMWEDRPVLVHGDVTPPNVLFGDELCVTAVDLERVRLADRVFDLGRLTGEIKHFFMQYAGNKDLAEPYIGHFLWEYAGHFHDRHGIFTAITRRLPFYMGLNLMRIARNPWFDPGYRRRLIQEAKLTLR
jgi:aminoglycoside phosphotransferase (APT) family kinase protein